MKRKNLFLLLVLIMESLIGCGQIADTLSGGGTEASFVIKFRTSGGDPVKTTGINVELVKADSQEVLYSKTTNNEDSLAFKYKISFDEKTYFLRARFPEGRVETSPARGCRGKFGDCPDCIDFTVYI